MKDKSNPLLRAAYLEAVDKQLQDNDPPETRQTFDRLRSEGYNEQDAKLLIASAIAAESYLVMKTQKPFNRDRFIRNLQKLPDQNFDEE